MIVNWFLTGDNDNQQSLTTIINIVLTIRRHSQWSVNGTYVFRWLIYPTTRRYYRVCHHHCWVFPSSFPRKAIPIRKKCESNHFSPPVGTLLLLPVQWGHASGYPRSGYPATGTTMPRAGAAAYPHPPRRCGFFRGLAAQIGRGLWLVPVPRGAPRRTGHGDTGTDTGTSPWTGLEMGGTTGLVSIHYYDFLIGYY